jgi:hypothetical protein
MSETVDEEKRLEEELAEQRPLYLIGLHLFLTVFFIIYDALVFIPFKLFADPEKKREISERVKVNNLLYFKKNLFHFRLDR